MIDIPIIVSDGSGHRLPHLETACRSMGLVPSVESVLVCAGHEYIVTNVRHIINSVSGSVEITVTNATSIPTTPAPPVVTEAPVPEKEIAEEWPDSMPPPSPPPPTDVPPHLQHHDGY